MWRRCFRGVVVLLAWVSQAHAEGRPLEADRHFKRGVELAQTGQLDDAVAEFERAYAESPHFAVLYNLGQAHGLAGRPVQATEALRRYLADGGSAIDARRRAEVEAAIRFNEQRIGTLEVETTPSTASITIDGLALPAGERRVALAAGRHGVVATLDGYLTEGVPVEIEGGQTTSVRLDLDPTDVLTPGWLNIECSVPDVHVEVDGRAFGRTPFRNLVAVAQGVRRVRFSRPWYVPKESDVVVGSTPATARCQMRAVNPLPQGAGASVRVASVPPSVEIWLDGVAYEGERVPAGRHHVQLEHVGFKSWTGDVDVGSSNPKTLKVALEPTLQFWRDMDERADRQRTWAYVTGGSGIALGLAGVALYVVSSRRFEEWQSDRNALMQELSEGPPSQGERDRTVELQEEAATIQRMDDASLALAVGAGLLLAVSTTLFITMPDVPPYASRSARAAGRPRWRSFEWRF